MRKVTKMQLGRQVQITGETFTEDSYYDFESPQAGNTKGWWDEEHGVIIINGRVGTTIIPLTNVLSFFVVAERVVSDMPLDPTPDLAPAKRRAGRPPKARPVVCEPNGNTT